MRTRNVLKSFFFFLFSVFISQLETRGILSHPLLPSIASSRVKYGVQKFKDACGRQDVHLRSAGSPIHTQLYFNLYYRVEIKFYM